MIARISKRNQSSHRNSAVSEVALSYPYLERIGIILKEFVLPDGIEMIL
jgi:hypothetical protein